jgi:fatty-acid desaturase
MVKQVLQLTKDPYIKYTNRYWALILAMYILALGLIAGISGIYFMFIVPSVLVMIAQALTNYINHSSIGYRNYNLADNSHNCIWLSVLNWGEGWHNNHHNNPSKSNLKEKWWELDISGWIIDRIKIGT